MDQIKFNIKAVVGSSKNGISLYSLENEYKNITNSALNYKNYNYPDLKTFLESMSDVVRLQQYNNGWFVHLVTTEDDPQCLMNLRNLIQHTKIKKGSKGNQNIPQNTMGRTNNYNLKISVPNDLCNNERTPYSSACNYDRQRNNTNLNQSTTLPPTFRNANNTPRNNGFSIYGAAPNQLRPNQSRPSQSIGATLFNNPMKHGYDTNSNNSSHMVAPNLNQNGTIILVETTASKVKSELGSVSGSGNQSKSPECAISWPIQLEIEVSVLHRRVKVLGIHAGHALVTVLDSIQPNSFIECKLFSTGTPGDFLLWQPPIPDSRRSKTAIDTCTAFPVILIGRLSTSMLQVRVLGLKVLLEVDVENTFEYPKNAAAAKQFLTAFQSREATLVHMAVIGPFVTIWDAPALSDVYFAPICLEDDRFIFERCDKRGEFLNVMLLAFYSTHMVSKMMGSKKAMFIGNLISQMDGAIKALQPAYEEMLTIKEKQTNIDSDILLPIFDRSDCRNQMLIGCTNFIDVNHRRSQSDVNASSLVLYRIVYNDRSNTFTLFDFSTSQVSVNWSDVPITGVYILNERFVNSRLSHMSKLRFQASMLLHIQDFATLGNL